MKIDKLNIIDKEANIILGAGATKGASCFIDSWIDAPLDLDFFEKVQKLNIRDSSSSLSNLLEFARNEFGNIATLSMEKFFTQIESLNSFHKSLKIAPGPRLRSYENILTSFSKNLAIIFSLLKNETKTKGLDCEYHAKLASSLQPRDVVISFNYDCIMDSAIKNNAKKRWSAENGYGFNITDGYNEWQDHSGKGKITKNTIKLLKVHGSLNWNRIQDPLKLRSDPYELTNRGENEIVPPVWNKNIVDDPILSNLWKQARSSLGRGPVLVLIGYSVPDTDLFSQSLLRVAPSEGNRKLSDIIVVNPDKNARIRTIDLLERAISSTTNIFEFKTLKDFSAIL
jgi:hypothetical protein